MSFREWTAQEIKCLSIFLSTNIICQRFFFPYSKEKNTVFETEFNQPITSISTYSEKITNKNTKFLTNLRFIQKEELFQKLRLYDSMILAGLLTNVTNVWPIKNDPRDISWRVPEVSTKAMQSVKSYGCYAETLEFLVIPTSGNTIINVRIPLH